MKPVTLELDIFSFQTSVDSNSFAFVDIFLVQTKQGYRLFCTIKWNRKKKTINLKEICPALLADIATETGRSTMTMSVKTVKSVQIINL